MSFKNLVNSFAGHVGNLAAILIGLILIMVIYKIIVAMTKLDSDKGRDELRIAIVYGLLTLFASLSFFAIARVVANSLGI